MEMAQYILQILKGELIVMLSWGFSSPIAVKEGLRFHVNGYLHQGWVEVQYDEGIDLFRVRLLKDGKVIDETSEVYFDNLVFVIDRMVETK